MPPDTSFLVNGFKPTIAAADPREVMAFRTQQAQAAQNRQIGAQQLQEGSVALQEKQRAYDEGTRLRQLFAQPGMTVQDALPHVMAINPQTGIAMQKGMFENQKTQLEIQRTQLENGKSKIDQLGAIAGSIHDDGSLHQGLATALGLGLIQPQEADSMLQRGYGPEVQAELDNHIQQAKDAGVQFTEHLANLKDAREKLEADQRTALAGPTLAKAQNEVTTSTPNAAGLTPQQQATKDAEAATLAQTKLRDAQTAKSENFKNSVAAADLDIKKRTFEATFGGAAAVGPDGKPLHGDAFLATLPQGRAAQIKQFASGAMDESDLPRGNAKQPFLDAVLQYDPTFNKQRAQTLTDFGPKGKTGQNIAANNTAVVHLDQLGDTAKALANGSFTPGNEIWNRGVTLFGGAAPTNFEGVRAAVASEMATALKGNATDQEINEMKAHVSAASSPQQLAGIVDQNLHVLGAKLNTRDEQYHADPGTGNPNYTPVLPTAQAVFDKHGIQPIQRLAAPPIPLKDGTTLTPHSKAQADAFRKDHPELIK